MKINDLFETVYAEKEAGNSVQITGKSGWGKSDFAHQFLAYWRRREPNLRIGMSTLLLATQTPPDILGPQFKGNGQYTLPDGSVRTFTYSDVALPRWCISDENLPYFAYDRFYVFFDEYGQGEPDVKRTSAEVFLKKRLGPHVLPDGSFVLAASNVGSAYGVTRDFHFTTGRKVSFELSSDIDGWLEWSDKPYEFNGRMWLTTPLFKLFAKKHPGIMFEEEPKDVGLPWCNPRSLCAADRFYQTLQPTDTEDYKFQEGLRGHIGVAAASQMAAFFVMRTKLPDFEDVVRDPKGTPLPATIDLKMLMIYELAYRCPSEVKVLQAVIDYVRRFTEKDMAIAFFRALTARDPKFISMKPMMDWAAQNSTLLAVLTAYGANR